jgi:RHS repeat-associated protein
MSRPVTDSIMGDSTTTGGSLPSVYDGLNRRVRKVVTNKGSLNGTTRYIWGGDSNWQCLEERDGSNDLVARYTYSPGYIDAVAVQERDLNSDDDFGDDDEVVYYHGNTLFSLYCLTDDGENVVERYRYDAYGGCTVLDADGSDDSDNASDVEHSASARRGETSREPAGRVPQGCNGEAGHNPFLFTGRRLDSEWAGMQYRHRSYSTTLGRFVSRDPAEYADGLLLYEYGGSHPTGTQDPAGLVAVGEVQETPAGNLTISWAYRWVAENAYPIPRVHEASGLEERTSGSIHGMADAARCLCRCQWGHAIFGYNEFGGTELRALGIRSDWEEVVIPLVGSVRVKDVPEEDRWIFNLQMLYFLCGANNVPLRALTGYGAVPDAAVYGHVYVTNMNAVFVGEPSYAITHRMEAGVWWWVKSRMDYSIYVEMHSPPREGEHVRQPRLKEELGWALEADLTKDERVAGTYNWRAPKSVMSRCAAACNQLNE